MRGDPEPAKALFSSRADVTLANPFGPTVRGKKQVDEVIERAAAGFGMARCQALSECQVTAPLTLPTSWRWNGCARDWPEGRTSVRLSCA